MNDRDALLAAIAASPEEETPRAMFLDWCEENATSAECPRCKGSGKGGTTWSLGKAWEPARETLTFTKCRACKGGGRVGNGLAEWAAFIRVQCERDEVEAIEHTCREGREGTNFLDGVSTCPACGAAFHADDLRQREFELLGDLAERLAVPALHALWPGVSHTVGHDGLVVVSPGGIRVGTVRLRRGHVAEVECDLSDWLAHGKAIVRAHPVQAVRVTDRRPMVTPDGMIWWGFQNDLTDGPDLRHVIPNEVMRLMRSAGKAAAADYDTEEDAFADLSRGLIAWAKARPA